MKTNSNEPTMGRPRTKIVWPQGRFTRQQAYDANPHVSRLTVVNRLVEALQGGKKSELVKTDELRENTSEDVRGRKQFVYIRRSKLEANKRLSRILTSRSKMRPETFKKKIEELVEA